MAEVLNLQAKNRVTLSFDRKAQKYFVKEISVFDNNLAFLLKEANLLLKSLDKGELAEYITSNQQDQLGFEYVCEVCGCKKRAFPDSQDRVRFECGSDKCLRKMRYWKKEAKN